MCLVVKMIRLNGFSGKEIVCEREESKGITSKTAVALDQRATCFPGSLMRSTLSA